MTRVIRSLYAPNEVAGLVDLYRESKARATRRGRDQYLFARCVDPPGYLVDRALAYLPLVSSAPFLDSFFIGYCAGQGIAKHTDERSELRLNVLIVEPIVGGILTVDGAEVHIGVGDAVIFSPRTMEHSVSKVEMGERVIWSVGRTRSPAQWT